MMFIDALYLPWCRYLGPQECVQPRLCADNLKCVSRDPGVLLRAARFTTGYVRLVGQELAPSKCVLLSTSRAVHSDMRRWVVTDEGDRWSVKLDVRDLGEHLDSTFRGRSATLAAGVRRVITPTGFSWETPGDPFHVYSWCFCMVLRLLFLLRPVCVSCELQVLRLFGLAVSLLPILVRCLVSEWLGSCVLRGCCWQ